MSAAAMRMDGSNWSIRSNKSIAWMLTLVEITGPRTNALTQVRGLGEDSLVGHLRVLWEHLELHLGLGGREVRCKTTVVTEKDERSR